MGVSGPGMPTAIMRYQLLETFRNSDCGCRLKHGHGNGVM